MRVRGGCGRRGLLLASSSLVALLSGASAAFAQCAITPTTNQSSVSNSGAVNCINIQGITVAGNVTNTGSGTITAFGTPFPPIVTGITINNASVGGSVSNAGTITASFGGINVDTNALVFGGIVNSGTISAGAGIGVDVSTFSGGISNSGTISAYGDGIVIGLVSTFSGGINNTGTITAGGGGEAILIISDSAFSGGVSNSGTISVNGSGVEVIGVSTYSGGVANSGRISASSRGIDVTGDLTFSGGISNSGTISVGFGAGIGVSFVSTFLGGISNSGTIQFGGIGVSNVSTFAGNISNSGTITAKTGISVGNGVTFAAGSAIVNSGTIIGSGGTAIDVSFATSPVTIDQTGGLIAGAIKLSANADVLNISGGTIAGNIVGAGTSDTINFALGSGTFIYNSAFTGINQVNINSGTVVLNGANTATNVDVNGGTLAGSGSIDPTVVTIHSGATFAPGTPGMAGTSMNIVGNLAFQSGALYLVTLGSTASRANVTGTASLNGTVTASVTDGVGKQAYDILHAGNVAGTFAGFTANGFTGSLTYTPTDVFLNLTANLGSGVTGLNTNQRNVAAGINNYFNGGGVLPAGFASLFALTGASFGYASTQLSGEGATDADKGAFLLMNDFLNLLLDPTAGGGGNISSGASNGFAPEQDTSLPADIALAYAKALKAPAQNQAPVGFDQRWTTWGSAFGGTSFTNGNAAIGSNNVKASDYGFAAGMEYRLTPDTVYGFGLAGGGTNWTLAQALGSGRSDSFQAGVYGKTHFGPAYLSAALAFANHWFSTERVVMSDQLRASFTGQSYAARLESGYRYAVPITGAIVGVAPYAALQAQDFHTPNYSETDLTGGGFGLSYASANATDTRSELGARFDNLQIVDSMPLVLRGRLAWAHDWYTNATALNAAFQALPGAGFTVNGAAPPKNSALTTAAAELHITPSWTAIAKFDGEFGGGAQTYGGTGTVRYSW